MEEHLHIIDHPMIQHKLTKMRDVTTSTKDFRELLGEIGMFMAYEVTRDLPLEDVEIETPICKTVGKQIAGRKLALVPILRAGIGMLDGILELVPSAKVGHVGLYRDPETLKPVKYYFKMPQDIDQREVIIVDPMLATGGSSCAAIDFIKETGATNIKLMCLIGAPEGVNLIQEKHPDVDIYLAALDDHLNEKGYIVPGLGDAGDRIFGTK